MSSQTPQIVEHPHTDTVVVVGRGQSMAELPAFFDSAFTLLGQAASAGTITPAGPAIARYLSEPTDVVDLEVGFAVTESAATGSAATGSAATGSAATGSAAVEGATASTLPAGAVARVVHAGSFDGLGASWQSLVEWVLSQGRAPHPEMGFWEAYLTEPTPDMDPADLRTELNLPLAPA